VLRLYQYEAEIRVNQPKLHVFMSEKGRGVCTDSPILSGQAVCEYIGNQISRQEAEIRAKQYTAEGLGCFIFYVKLDNSCTVCIDATAEDGSAARLINHSLKCGNLKPTKISKGDTVRIFLLAPDNISANTELLYDYGERAADTAVFLRESPVPIDVDPSSFCGTFSLSQVLA
jgi:SET domain-containing protein